MNGHFFDKSGLFWDLDFGCRIGEQRNHDHGAGAFYKCAGSDEDANILRLGSALCVSESLFGRTLFQTDFQVNRVVGYISRGDDLDVEPAATQIIRQLIRVLPDPRDNPC